MDSFPQQQKPKSSVFSLLNPINEEPSASYSSQNFSKRTFENPALQSNRNEASNTNEKRKRVRMFGLELDVPYNENPKELLITAHDQLELFTNNLYHAQTQEYQHQEELQKGVIQTPTVEHNNNNNNKSTPYTDSERTEEYQRLISYMDYMFQHQYNPSVSSYNQVQPPAFMPTTISPTASTQPNPCSLPSILNPPLTVHTTTYSQLDSQAFLSQRIKQSPLQVTAEQIEPTATSPSSPYTASPHKYRTVLIQPSSQDPPIEARLIVDDPKTNPFTQQWLEHFQELKAFKEQFGHTNVTRSITGYYNLGNWVAEQRRKFKQGKVTESQFNCLNQIGFEWDRSYYFFRTRHKKTNSMGSEKESPRTE